MLTQESRENMGRQILKSCRQLVLSKYISETCVEKATDEQLQFVLELLAEEIKRREENKVKRAIKRANFPDYKTFNGYEYKTVKLPTILSKEELESLDFVAMKKNLVLCGFGQDTYGNCHRHCGLSERLQNKVFYSNRPSA